MNIIPPLQTDYYKVQHHKMYPENMTKLYSNGTPRKSRIPGVNKFVFFGLQYFILEYLIQQWKELFFLRSRSVISEYKRMMDYTLGKDVVSMKQWEALYDMGYLPLHIKALPEGSLCPVSVPFYTITNTHEDFGWLVNYLETIMNCTIWQPIVSATLARGLLKVQELFKDGKHHTYVLFEQQTWEQEKTGALETVFLDGKLVKFQTLSEIRNRINENLDL